MTDNQKAKFKALEEKRHQILEDSTQIPDYQKSLYFRATKYEELCDELIVLLWELV